MIAKSLVKKIGFFLAFFLMTFLLKAQLVTQFTGTPLSGCAPFSVNFTDQSTGNPNFWKWDLGNSTVSFIQNPSTVYLNPGTYSVKLVIKNAVGTTDSLTKTAYINVYSKPAANFSATPLTGCFPLPVSFTDLSTPGSGTITNWLWDFGDGNTSTIQHPSHTYSASGNYTAFLLVTNSNGCSKSFTRTNYVSISSGVTAAFTNSMPSSCAAPQTINFQNQSTSTGTISYLWSYGDGATSTGFAPAHTYTTAGSYLVQLIVTNSTGCTDTFTNPSPIIIGSVTTDFTAPPSACVGTAISLINTSSPAPVSSAWTFGDGTTSTTLNPVKTYSTAGNYDITLTNDFGGCQATKVYPITIFAKPTTVFSGAPINSCAAPLTVNFSNTTVGAVSYEWIFGDGIGTSNLQNPTYTYDSASAYTVTLITTNSNGCSDTLVKADYVKIQPPVAQINNLPRQGCAPLSVTFSSTITSVDQIVSYQWDFGNGITSNLQDPSFTFPAGNYDIQLVVTTAGGCTDTVKVLGGVKAAVKPIANFNATPADVCAKLDVQFNDLSVGTVTTWLWDFGDGNTSTTANPTHAYEDTGFFTIRLIVYNNGCADTLIIPDYIHIKPPVAIFTVAASCVNKFTKTFVDQSIGADTWSWNFGDGNTSTVKSPVHTYATVGTYTVSLTVTNISTGCNYTKTSIVTIANEEALFAAASTELCKNTFTVFTATSMQANSSIVNYEWDFGDLTGPFTGNNASHSYTAAGLYTVRLIITDANGCKDTLTKNQYIKVNGPTAGFSPAVPGSCLNASVTFNDQSTTDGTHALTTWYWNYGDGVRETLTAAPFQHMYGGSGAYNVSLVVQDNYGCKDSTGLNNALIISTPVADYTSKDTLSCPNKPVIFQNLSTGPSLTYTWSFGDGGTSTQQNPVHLYTTDGLYTVNLTVTDMYGCTASKSIPQYIVVNAPVADFTVTDSFTTCPPLIMQFTNTSQHIQSFLWNFGDGGGTGSVLNPPHIYGIPGFFPATLTVTTFGGCTDVKTKLITVRGPQGTFSYNPLVGCTPLNVTFTATTKDRLSFVWDFNDGGTMATLDSVLTYPYTLPGMYVPKMILTDAAGCNIAIQGIDTIRVSGVITAFSSDTLTRCTSGNVVFANTTASNDIITGYEWSFGDGDTSTLFEPTHFYASTGLYYPQLIANTQSGCTDTVISPVPIRVVKTPVISVSQSANGCVPLTMNFNGNLLNGDTASMNWQWVFNNGLALTGQNLPAQVFNTGAQYAFSLTATNSSGCMDTAYSNFEAYPKPIINAGSDVLICQGTGQTVSATGGASYTWSPSAGLSCINCASPVATPDSSRDYTVTGMSALGCTNTDVVSVFIKYPFHMLGGLPDTLCVGQASILTVSGAATYLWSPTTGLSASTDATVTATPSVTTNYMVIGRDDKNCFSDTAYFPIKVHPLPTVAAGANKTINVGQTLTLTPTVSADVTSVKWSPTTWLVSSNLPSITVKPNYETQYTVKVENEGGCTASSAVTVFVLCDGANVFIPNTFSPNGDGANDVFYPRGTGLFTVKQARIFTRWGEEVFARYSFKANDASMGWDGTFKGQKFTADVYVYIIEIQCDNNSTLVYKGNVALIK
ncbi:MAG: PKD domain-containing protein [Ferruginibacter sp.]